MKFPKLFGNKQKKTEFSKKVTVASVILAYLFVIFVCYEIHIQQNLEPIAYIGSAIVLMLGICVRAYMKRAYQQDLTYMKVNQARMLSELKQQYGDDFVYENIDDVNLDS